MQFKALIALAALATAAVAVPTGGGGTTTPLPPPATIPASQCNTGPIQCCNSVQDPSSAELTRLFALLGINVEDVTALVGVTCSPISIIGLPGNSCSAQPVCCSNNTYNGVVAIGCTPVNINL